MSNITDFVKECHEGIIQTNEKKVEYVLNEFISYVFNAIDDELFELQKDVESGRFSNQEIYDRIQEIRNEL